MKMIIVNGVTVRTLDDNLVNDTVASLQAALPDAKIVVVSVLDGDPPDNLPEIE